MSEPLVELEIVDPRWLEALPDLRELAERAIASAAAVADRDQEASPTTALTVAAFFDDAELAALNTRHRGQDKPTNVLAFPAAPGAGYLGDLALAFETCRDEAAALGAPLSWRTAHLLVHGYLHLRGYDHGDDAEAVVMEALEARALEPLGVPDPYGDPAHA